MSQASIDIRVSDRRAKAGYVALRAVSPRDTSSFARVCDSTTRANPSDPLIISINGHAHWLGELMSSCISDRGSDPALANREVQYSDTVQFPEKSDRRSSSRPWTFITDQINLPHVYYWTFGLHAPYAEDSYEVSAYEFRIGGWACAQGAYKDDRRIPVIVIFTRPTEVSELVVSDFLFPHLFADPYLEDERDGPAWIAWTFSQLYDLLTDWQNVIRDIERRLDEAELNSRGRDIPVKLRTRSMHKQVDRIYELSEYLQFHVRSFKKLAKIKTQAKSDSPDDEDQPIWDQVDDSTDDLDHYSNRLDSLKDRFNNLIELEFNIESATQSDNSRFLSILGTLFLPVSYIASLFGFSSVTWPALWYVYVAVPVFVISAIFTGIFPFAVTRYQRAVYPYNKAHVPLGRNQYTMLGNELPDSADAPRTSIAKHARKDRSADRDKRGSRREKEVRSSSSDASARRSRSKRR